MWEKLTGGKINLDEKEYWKKFYLPNYLIKKVESKRIWVKGGNLEY